MTNTNETQFNSWEEVIVDFFENRVGESKLYKAREFIKKKQDEIEIEKNEKKLSRLKQSKAQKEQELDTLRMQAPHDEIRQWIEKNYNKNIAEGERISLATHLSKFTHSSARVAGFIVSNANQSSPYLSTSVVKNTALDLAHNNASLITISRFLDLSFDGKSIIKNIYCENFDFLNPFKEDKNQREWQVGFANLVEKRKDKRTDKLKQIYFPLEKQEYEPKEESDRQQYHLLVPYFSSSLCQKFYEVSEAIKYSKEYKYIREGAFHKDSSRQPNPLFRNEKLVEYPNQIIEKFGGEYARNVSMLNADRSGKNYLFSCQPPVWSKQLKPPVYKDSLFYGEFSYWRSTQTCLDILAAYLVGYELSTKSHKSPERVAKLKALINQLADASINYALRLHELSPGWTSTPEVKLKNPHQYWLDPCREDADFQQARAAKTWHSEIVEDFAKWLNHQLKERDKGLNLGKEQQRIWVKMAAENFRQFNELID